MALIVGKQPNETRGNRAMLNKSVLKLSMVACTGVLLASSALAGPVVFNLPSIMSSSDDSGEVVCSC